MSEADSIEDKITLHRFNGDAIYYVTRATISHWTDEEDDLFAANFCIWTDPVPFQTLPDIANSQVAPYVEVTALIPKEPAYIFFKGKSFKIPPDGLDNLKNIFWWHEGILFDAVQIEILDRVGLLVKARITCMCADMNYYYSDPTKRMKVVVETSLDLLLK